jgi:hypothetical protein
VSVDLADAIIGPARGDDHGQAGRPDADRGVGLSDRSPDRSDRMRADARAGLCIPCEPPSPARFAARVDFLKNEVFEICDALARAEVLLARLGLVGEAAYLATVFDVAEGRLADSSPTVS